MPIKYHCNAAHEQLATCRNLDLAVIDVDQSVVHERRQVIQFILKIGIEIDAMRTLKITNLQAVMAHELLNDVGSNAIVLINFDAAFYWQGAA
jgi:hypothetical protein